MICDQNPDILMFQLCDNALDILYGNRVYPGKRFVKHDKFRIDSQTASDLRTPAFTSGQLVAQILPHFIQTKFGNQTLQFFFLVFGCCLCHFQYGTNVILHRHFTENRRLLS